ncbi:hypothetical protein RPPS3_25900 [Rhodopseudomonas palustris]|uniref:hypothetical protein n=1 Tax=Rhodopseudomonas palustris TaxID=1076 RepID=UPI000D1B2CCE|nr:hypothetical protein [Rhodopseudomonas palustris]AVT76653.1 hypothetical protein RPPS3_25900 [Rhodopseudomonas palustris]
MTMNDIVPRPRFEPTYNFGHILILIGWLAGGIGGGFGVYLTLRTEMSQLRSELALISLRMMAVEKGQDKLAAGFDRMTEILTSDARQNVRLDSVETRLGAIEHRGLTGPR